MAYEGPIQELIDELARLPGVGPKSAQRLAFWLVKADPADAKRLAIADTPTILKIPVVPISYGDAQPLLAARPLLGLANTVDQARLGHIDPALLAANTTCSHERSLCGLLLPVGKGM